jgi:hypothetical protein
MGACCCRAALGGSGAQGNALNGLSANLQYAHSHTGGHTSVIQLRSMTPSWQPAIKDFAQCFVCYPAVRHQSHIGSLLPCRQSWRQRQPGVPGPHPNTHAAAAHAAPWPCALLRRTWAGQSQPAQPTSSQCSHCRGAAGGDRTVLLLAHTQCCMRMRCILHQYMR